MIELQQVLDRVEEILQKEGFPHIQSRQVHALATALIEAINKELSKQTESAREKK
jgi:hypothetical protein